MYELREIVTLFSSTSDMDTYIESYEISDEVLANLMIYRYENHISVLDDQNFELSDDYITDVEKKLWKKFKDNEWQLKRQWEKEHPEEAKAIFERELKEITEYWERATKEDEERFKNYTKEDWEKLIYYKSGQELKK